MIYGLCTAHARRHKSFHIHTQNDDEGLKISTEGINESIYLHLAESDLGDQYGYFHLGEETVLRGNGKVSYFKGNVGIGNTNPSEKLYVNGNVRASCGILSCSDQRYKTNILPISGALTGILNLQAVYFDWKTAEFPEESFRKSEFWKDY